MKMMIQTKPYPSATQLTKDRFGILEYRRAGQKKKTPAYDNKLSAFQLQILEIMWKEGRQ